MELLMLNAVMLTCNRSALTQQALETFFRNSKLDWTLVIVDDGSEFQTLNVISRYAMRHSVKVIHVEDSIHNTAMLRNLGVYFSEHYWGRGDYLYLSDNDAFFTEGWDIILGNAYAVWGNQFKLIGPYRHPYHQDNGPSRPLNHYNIHPTDAVQGIGHFMTWETWDRYGPLIEHRGDGLGTNQSEDFHFCQQIVKDGYFVGSVQPDVVYNCGLTGSNGKRSPGHEVIQRIKGVYYE